MEWEKEYLRNKNGIALGLVDRAGDFVFEGLADRPEREAQDRAHYPRVSKQLSFHPRVDVALQIDRAPIPQSRHQRFNFQILRVNDAVRDGETRGALARAAASQSRHDGVEGR